MPARLSLAATLLRQRIAAAERATAVPTDNEIEAGNYRKGKFTAHGLEFTIETATGQTRRSKPGRPKWSIVLKNPYGYINGTTSAEGKDQMDFFMGPTPESEIVYVVDQNKQDRPGVFDEHKVIFGCTSAREAKQLYLDNYTPNWKGFRAITPVTVEQFRAWLKHGDMMSPIEKQPLSDFFKQAAVKQANPLRGVLDLLRRVPRPSGAQLNKYVNPWHTTGNPWLDTSKALVPAGAAAVPVTEAINENIYGKLMGRHYTDPSTGQEHLGIDPTSKVMELGSNAAMLLPFFHPASMKHLAKNPGPALLAKGTATMVIPSVADVFGATKNTEAATGALATTAGDLSSQIKSVQPFMDSLGEVGKSIAPAAKELPDAVQNLLKGMRENRDWATPIIGGGVGAALGNMAGSFAEDDFTKSKQQRTNQKRLKLLLTLLGGGAGTLIGARAAARLPMFSPSEAELAKLRGAIKAF